MNKHSGKLLANIPFEDIYVGMRVVSRNIHVEGEVEDVQVVEDIVEQTKKKMVFLRWDSGYPSFGEHFVFKHVKVK